MSFYTTSLGPPVGDSTAMYAPPLRYKREALATHFRHAKTLTTQARFHSEQPCSQPLESASNTTHSGRRVLRSGGPNHSKPAVFITFFHRDWANPSEPSSTHPLGLGGCTTPPGCGFAHQVVVCGDPQPGGVVHPLIPEGDYSGK